MHSNHFVFQKQNEVEMIHTKSEVIKSRQLAAMQGSQDISTKRTQNHIFCTATEPYY